MRKFISWNNKRRDWSYWLAIELLLLTGLNISWWLDTSNSIIKLINSFMTMTFNLYKVQLFIRSILPIHLVVILVIACINHLVSFLPDIKRVKLFGLFQFCLKSAFLSDLMVGILLEGIALEGLRKLGGTLQTTSIAMWGYYAIFLIGSFLYWKHVFPVVQYFNTMHHLLNGQGYEKNTWYNVSNSNLRFSTFDRVPNKGKITEVIVDCFDLEYVNFFVDMPIKEEYFLYYLICIDRGQEINADFVQTVKKIVNLPHAKTLICFFGDENHGDGSKKLADFLSKSKNVRIHDFGRNKYNRNTDIEKMLSDSNIRSNDSIFIPFRTIDNAHLMHTYMSIGKGPKLCLDFMKTILNNLDTLPAIYALFDYIDLQYRIAISNITDINYCWMKSNSRNIGNLFHMAELIEEDILKIDHSNRRELLSPDELFHEIITADEFSLVRKYLPNYEIDNSRPTYETVIYLTASLRNVLRGHGMLETSDADALFILVFKLALLNTYILNANSISMSVNCEKVWDEHDFYSVTGITTTGDVKKISPFFVADINGDMLVFNNWILPNSKGEEEKEKIEYINYLDGSLIMPEFRSITIEEM